MFDALRGYHKIRAFWAIVLTHSDIPEPGFEPNIVLFCMGDLSIKNDDLHRYVHLQKGR